MSFPKYPAYKDSGVEWIGEIPVGWHSACLKHVAIVDAGQSPASTDCNTEGCGLPFLQGCADFGVCYPVPKNYCTIPPKSCCKEDILLSVRAPVGRLNVADRQYGIGRGLCSIRPSSSHDKKYFLYTILFLEEYFHSISTGSTYEAISTEQIKNTILFLPPLPEQQAIASFLDRECGKIDALIAEQERLIALLAEKRQAVISHAVTKGLNPNAPMKDSGIPWIGMVSEEWEIVRLGTIFEEVNESGNENLPILSVSIHTGVSDEELSDEKLDRKVTRSDDRSKYIAVRPGDLTYNMMRAWQGGFGTVQVMGMVSPAYVVARPKNISRQKTDFIELLLRTPNAISEMKRYSRGVTDFRLRLYWEEFKKICIPLPILKEQDEILNFLKEKTGHFDALATTARNAITLLKERRAALISAAVTGKIDVRAQSKALAA
ncbi:hypothetical protein SXCC_02458 [Gluconacetobacter sp. SXCC-1]|uniref:Restriction endonuclease subunit S n=1 Tax=Komagataeibacter rhaeticus TaxID=215221 RepID=A0A181CAC0_9PROT|nr:restriction endonuclease subunit S [Komagataeibacter rhaeticus]ATU72971.1 restriction endonuclease subunit S [Komagataeibacter xylinus]EGG77246.1 hypothetical protein SXCC_02458 [Gluconacetobacter sp. SXCC-1]QIP35283.1 restriction endonuclease subunit S [Komagataeibacter rhaeticus]QOC47847.1 restriction endonuclease subunit S [Komagataeibacter rhaeticus]WPP22781.1 restriction endonuclease subunit S [Komagataeibacter rhaeticus]